MISTPSAPAVRALLIGDSLGAPRPHRGQKLESTWPVLLKCSFPQIDLWQRCRAAAMSDAVLKEYNQFSDSIDSFGLLVIQVGIGDCCPRPYPYFLEQALITYGFRRLHKRLNALYPLLLKLRSKPWISCSQFIANIKFMIDTTRDRNPGASICIVKIGPPCGDFVRKVHNVAVYAALYNNALEALCRSYGRTANVFLVDPYSGIESEKLFIADGHHLTVLGHKAVAQALEYHFERLTAEFVLLPESLRARSDSHRA